MAQSVTTHTVMKRGKGGQLLNCSRPLHCHREPITHPEQNTNSSSGARHDTCFAPIFDTCFTCKVVRLRLNKVQPQSTYVHPCMHTSMHTYVRMYAGTGLHGCAFPYAHTLRHARMREACTHGHTCIYKYLRTHVRTYVRAYSRASLEGSMRTYMDAQTCAYAPTRTYINTYMQATRRSYTHHANMRGQEPP